MAQPIRLYDLSNDLGENRNLATEHPERIEQLARLMDQAYEVSERWRLHPSEGSESAERRTN